MNIIKAALVVVNFLIFCQGIMAQNYTELPLCTTSESPSKKYGVLFFKAKGAEVQGPSSTLDLEGFGTNLNKYEYYRVISAIEKYQYRHNHLEECSYYYGVGMDIKENKVGNSKVKTFDFRLSALFGYGYYYMETGHFVRYDSGYNTSRLFDYEWNIGMGLNIELKITDDIKREKIETLYNLVFETTGILWSTLYETDLNNALYEDASISYYRSLCYPNMFTETNASIAFKNIEIKKLSTTLRTLKTNGQGGSQTFNDAKTRITALIQEVKDLASKNMNGLSDPLNWILKGDLSTWEEVTGCRY